ncbi:hypothetical protein HN51_068022, partial [Arachis hypogaea]
TTMDILDLSMASRRVSLILSPTEVLIISEGGDSSLTQRMIETIRESVLGEASKAQKNIIYE